jgi:hypothetical protein
VDRGVSHNHFRIKQRMFGKQAMKIATMPVRPVEHWRDGKPIIRIVAIFICYFSHLNNNPENAIHAAIRSRLLEVVSGGAKSHKDGK